MIRIFRPRNLIVGAMIFAAFLALQIYFWVLAGSARAITLEFLGRGVYSETQLFREEKFYLNGKDRWTFQIPDFDETFPMHKASFRWNENRHVPPDAATEARETWVGTCLLTPKSPWRQIDLLGILGPIECKVYGDWHTESNW